MKPYTSPTIKVHRLTPMIMLAGSLEVTATDDNMGGTEEQYFGAKEAGTTTNDWGANWE